MRRIAIIASASGNGKTTLGRELARRLDVPFVEMDALVHGPNWVELPDDALRELLEPIVASDGCFSRDSLLLYALRAHVRHRRSYPRRLAGYDVVRLRSQREVEEWLASSG